MHPQSAPQVETGTDRYNPHPMHVVIFEPNAQGHRATHVRRLLPDLAALAGRVTLVTSPSGRASQEYQTQVKPIEHLCTVDESVPFSTANVGMRAFDGIAGHIVRIARRLKADHILMPYSDATIQMAGLRRLTGRFFLPRGVEVEGLMMRGTFAYERPATLKEHLTRRIWLTTTAAAPFRVVHHMDPIVVAATRTASPRLARRMRLIPDPVEAYQPPTHAEARRRLGLRDDGRFIGCSGYQDRRKGIDVLIRTFLTAGLGPTDRLFLAGKQEPQIRAMLAGEAAGAVRDGRILSIDRYISDEELRLSIAAMDVVCTPYPPDSGHCGSSSIAIHAAGQSRPVLGCNAGWVGDTIPRFDLGWTCDVLNPEAFRAAVRAGLDAAPGFRLTEGGRRFVEFHRPDNFVACFLHRLKERLGRPQSDLLRTWDWVLEGTTRR